MKQKFKCIICNREAEVGFRKKTCSSLCAKEHERARKKNLLEDYWKTDKYKAYRKAYYLRMRKEKEQ